MLMQKTLLTVTALCGAVLIGAGAFHGSASATDEAAPQSEIQTESFLIDENEDGTIRYSTDDGETWLEPDPERVNIARCGNGEEEVSVTITDNDLIEGEELAIQYDTETGEVLQSKDGGLTWEPLDANVSIEFEEGASEDNVTITTVTEAE